MPGEEFTADEVDDRIERSDGYSRSRMCGRGLCPRRAPRRCRPPSALAIAVMVAPAWWASWTTAGADAASGATHVEALPGHDMDRVQGELAVYAGGDDERYGSSI